MSEATTLKPDMVHAAVCGLFCPSCSIFIGSHGDEPRLSRIAERMHTDKDSLRCEGCRSDKLAFHCRDCSFRSCAQRRGISFCSECDSYPCGDLKEFQSAFPHRIDLWKSLDDVRAHGFDEWHAHMMRDYSCEKCGTINSAYDLACGRCGSEPGCPYVRRNTPAIMGWMEK